MGLAGTGGLPVEHQVKLGQPPQVRMRQRLQHPRQDDSVTGHDHHPGTPEGMGGEVREVGQQGQRLHRMGRVGDDCVDAAGCHKSMQARHRGGVHGGGLVRRPGRDARQCRRLLRPCGLLLDPLDRSLDSLGIVLASPLTTRSTALFCTSVGRSAIRAASLHLTRHPFTASCSAGAAGLSSDSTRLASETSLVETPINFAASPWVIFRKFAEFSSDARGLPGTDHWDIR